MTNLDLSQNRLNQFNEEKWTAFFECLKFSNVIKLDLRNNDLSEKRFDKLEEILKIKYRNSNRNNVKRPEERTPYSLKELCNFTLFTKTANYQKAIENSGLSNEVTKNLIEGIDCIDNDFGLKRP